MTSDCLVSTPLRKQMFHQDCIDLRSLIIIYDIDSNSFNLMEFLETSDCTDESWKDETCLQLMMKKLYIKT